jgi:hypothetical protein
MPEESHTIVAGMVIAIIVLLIAASFIFILVTYSNNKKKKYLQEKQHLQLVFKEQLLQSRVEMQEQTFNSISREIHDNVGQTLSLAKVQLNIMEQGHTLNVPLLADIKETVGKAMDDLRDIAKSLNSDRVKLCSLAEMTAHELQRIHRLGTIQALLSVQGQEKPLEEQKKLIVFRIIQESLQNILKHAHAKKIEVLFNYTGSHFTCTITDDGIGFNQQLVKTTDGLGLQNMTNRAALIGGQVAVNSIVNSGTTITIDMPYEQ